MGKNSSDYLEERKLFGEWEPGSTGIFSGKWQTGEPYANITVNIEKLGENLAAVDSNNLGAGIVTFLEHEGIAKSLGIDVYSGYCAYPIMDFTPAALEEMEEM